MRRLLGAFIHRESPAGWNRPRDSNGAELDTFTLAHKFGDEIVTSEAHSRSQTRCSNYVQLRLLGAPFGGIEAAASFRVAAVKYFFRACKRPQGQQPRMLRLAVCSLYRADNKDNTLVINPASPKHKTFVVNLESMDRKLVQAAAPGGSALICSATTRSRD